jgi:hypothetical protein
MRVCLLMFLLACAGDAQPRAVLDGLERRALAALARVPHSKTAAEAEARRGWLRGRLEGSLGLDRVQSGRAAASLDLPVVSGRPAPAILVLCTHDDPKAESARIFALSAARLGFVILSLDVREDHAALGGLYEGLTPQTLMQGAVRRGLEWIASRTDVDRGRIGLMGSGLAAGTAAALNPRFRAIVLTDGIPDFAEELSRLRASGGNEAPDGCLLIPGLLGYAAAEEMVAMIAPRPLFVLGAEPRLAEYGNDLYRSFGSLASFEPSAAASQREVRFAAYRWFARWLQDRPDLPGFTEAEPTGPLQPADLPEPRAVSSPARVPFSRAVLDRLLGVRPAGLPIGYGLNVAPRQEIAIEPEAGLRLPVTVFRPGPEGGDPDLGHLIALDDSGREALAGNPVVQEALRRKWVVWAIDPRGIGRMRSGREGFVFTVNLLLGENFVWREADDIARLVLRLAEGTMSHRVAIYARGPHAGLIAVYAGAMEPDAGLAWMALENPAPGFSSPGRVPLFWPAVGAAGTFDIPDLTTAARTKVLTIASPDELTQTEW